MARRKLFAVALAVLATIATFGCSPSSLGWLLSDTKAKPDYPLPPKAGKKDVTVLVIASQGANQSNNPLFSGAEKTFARELGARLVADSADTKHPIHVIDQTRLDQYKDKLGDWRAVNSALIGKKLGADYVIDCNLEQLSVFQPEDAGEYYSGRAKVNVSVYDTDKPDAVLQSYPHHSMQPKKGKLTLDPSGYLAIFLKRLGAEVAWKHVPHESQEQRFGKID